MPNEIERKFIVRKIPSKYQNQEPIEYERYYLYSSGDVELRVQKKGNRFELERKVKSGKLSRDTQKLQITEEEFKALIKLSTHYIKRKSYLLEKPHNTIKEYLDTYKGLIRAEFEFNNESEANNFVPPEWVGQEITYTKLGKDSKLINLSKSEFKNLLDIYLS